MEITCSGTYFTSLAEDFGTGSLVADDYPYSTVKTAADTDQLFAGDNSLTVKVNNKEIEIQYEGEFV